MKPKEMKYFYTLADIVTVCLIVIGNNCARGLSICSPQDEFDKREGMRLAYRYACMAMGRSKQLRQISNPQAIAGLIKSGCPFVKRGERNPVLTWAEVRMIRGKVRGPFYFSDRRLHIGQEVSINIKGVESFRHIPCFDFAAMERRVASTFGLPSRLLEGEIIGRVLSVEHQFQPNELVRLKVQPLFDKGGAIS